MLKGRIGAVELAELAGRKGTYEWRLPSTDLRRLAGLTADDIPESAYGLKAVVEFNNGSEGFPVLRLVVTGDWPLVCQRCLSGVTHAVDIEGTLTILPSESDAEHVADPFDCVVMDTEGFRLLDVIEDEVLAALPMSPVHEPATQCVGNIDRPMAPVVTETASNRPFAGLAGLMKRSGIDTTG